VIVFSDAADFIVSVTEALGPESNVSESSRVLMLTAAIETLYRVHKKQKPEREDSTQSTHKKRDDGCTIT
jgi:hypothetical protein